MADLKRKSVRGGMVTITSQGLRIIIQLAATVVLARLLSPDEYGVMTMVLAITAFAGLFCDLGLSSAAIQKKDLSLALQSNLFWINVGTGSFLTVLVAIGAPLVAWFYGNPELTHVTRALSVTFLIGSIGTQHGAMLVRNMQLARKELAYLVGVIVNPVIAITLALLGYSYWSLVWGLLGASLVTTTMLFILSPFRPGRPSLGSGMQETLGFGANVTAFDFINYFHRNLDNILIGRVWGAHTLGFYSRAYSLLMLPLVSLRSPIIAVAFPALSKLQEEPAAYRQYYLKITHMLALASMPLTAFLFVAAKPVILLALGPQWSAVVPIFSILALVGFVQPVITLWGIVVLSQGLGRRYLHLGIFNTLCSALGFLAGLKWGALGVAAGYAVVTYVTAYPILRWAYHGTPVSFRDFCSSTAQPFLASIAAALLCQMASQPLAALPPLLWAASVGTLFLVIYVIVIRLLPGGKADFTMLSNLLKPLVSKFGFLQRFASRISGS
jgi:PST family polysaccharide transporter